MYAKCGALTKAQQVLHGLPARDAVNWNALITGYVQHGNAEEALSCLNRMQHEGVSPDAFTFACALRACGSIGAVAKGEKIHEEIVKQRLLKNDIVLGNALVDMYAKCGYFEKAQKVIYELPARDIISWNALMTGYVLQGRAKEVLSCIDKMQCDGLSPDAVTFACALQACGILREAEKGEQFHAEILKQCLLKNNVILGTTLVDMYVKCGILAKARKTLHELPVRDVVSWNALIAGYTQTGKAKEALHCIDQMPCDGIYPDAATFVCALRACGRFGAVDRGEQIHAEITKQQLLQNNVVLGTALVDMYAKCGFLEKARQVLHELYVWDAISWTALIAGYTQHGKAEEALSSFNRMQHEGLCPTAVTFACALRACASIGAASKGQQIYEEIVKQQLLEDDDILGTALVDMYAKCGSLEKAQKVLDEFSIENIASWNALMAGYSQQGKYEEVLNCIDQMQCKDVFLDGVSFVYALRACGSVGTLDKGEEIYREIVKQQLLVNDSVLGTALVDMYAKCGTLGKASEVFHELPVRDVICWTSLIAGYTHQGNCKEAMMCLDQMQHEGHFPSAVTCLCVLNVCSHSGLLAKAVNYFAKMSTNYDITAGMQHHSCMVDLFGRAGRLDKVLAVIEGIPYCEVLSLWCALLGACQKWKIVEVARLAFDHLVLLNKYGAAAYILMSNIYVAVGMHNDANKIDNMRVKNEAWIILTNNHMSDAYGDSLFW